MNKTISQKRAIAKALKLAKDLNAALEVVNAFATVPGTAEVTMVAKQLEALGTLKAAAPKPTVFEEVITKVVHAPKPAPPVYMCPHYREGHCETCLST